VMRFFLRRSSNILCTRQRALGNVAWSLSAGEPQPVSRFGNFGPSAATRVFPLQLQGAFYTHLLREQVSCVLPSS
jgi:hypothetical protein